MITGLYLDPGASPIGRVIAFMSARGGAGSSTIAHNVGWCIAEEFSIHTTIVDFDLPFGTTGLDFNDESGQGVAEALTAPERLDDVLLDRLLMKRGEHLSLFTAPAALDRDYDAVPEAYESVIDAVRQTTPCVIVDLPHVWTPWVRSCLIAADEIVLVATPDLASLRNAKNMIELVRNARPNDAAPRPGDQPGRACPNVRRFLPRISPKPWASNRPPSCHSIRNCSARPPTMARWCSSCSPNRPACEAVRKLATVADRPQQRGRTGKARLVLVSQRQETGVRSD